MIFPNEHITRETTSTIIRELYFLKEITSTDVLRCAEQTGVIINSKPDIESLPYFKSLIESPYYKKLAQKHNLKQQLQEDFPHLSYTLKLKAI